MVRVPHDGIDGALSSATFPTLGSPDGYCVTYNQGGVSQVFIGATACVVDRNSIILRWPCSHYAMFHKSHRHVFCTLYEL